MALHQWYSRCVTYVAVALFAFAVLIAAQPARAQEPIVVNTPLDEKKANDNICSLREAIIAANADNPSGSGSGECRAGSGVDTIVLAAGTYSLTSSNSGDEDASATGDLDITGPVTLRRSGSGLVVIDASDITNRVIEVLSDGVSIEGITIRGGSAGGNGGGVLVGGNGDLQMVNSTLTNNTASDSGGGIAVEDDAALSLINVTIANNSAATAGAIYAEDDTLVGNTIFGANSSTSGDPCVGKFTTLGPNVAVHPSCAIGAWSIIADPALVATPNATAPTFYQIQTSSPAYNAGATDICPDYDQLGVQRPQLGACDIGAHELVAPPPTANAANTATNEDVALDISLTGANGGGPSLTFTIVEGPSHGTLNTPVAVSPTSATVTYTPSANYFGPDSFTFKVSNTYGESAPASVAITVNPVNDSPDAISDSAATAEETAIVINVAANDTDIDSNPPMALNPASVSVVVQPSAGSAVPVGDGSVTYTPAVNRTGTDTFTYRICDAAGACDTAAVTVTVSPVNDNPVAVDNDYVVAEDAVLTVAAPGVLGNDTDVDNDALSVIANTQPAQGVVAQQPNGAFTYTPAKNFDGADSFTYTASDGKGGSASATVRISVTPDAVLEVTNVSDSGSGSLRNAILRANSTPGANSITFEIPGAGPHIINVLTQLPPLTGPVVIDGNTQPQGEVVLDGGLRDFPAFVLQTGASGSTIQGLTIQNFGGAGIVIERSGSNIITDNVIRNNGGGGITILGDPANLTGSGGNQITGNAIVNNRGNGITIVNSVNNALDDNDIHGNSGISVDLGGDGRTPNDPGDVDTGANFVQNFPVLIRTVPPAVSASAVQAQSATGEVVGWLNSKPGSVYTVRVYAGPSCDTDNERVIPTTPSTVATGADGTVYFTLSLNVPVQAGEVIRMTATDGNGNTSEYSDCIIAGVDNDSWPRALTIDALGKTATVQQHLDQLGQSRWYRFHIQPHSQVQVLLTDLPANYDLTIYKDIATTYADLVAADDPVSLSAEFAPSAFSPSAFSPSAFSPSAFSPSAFSPSAFSPSAFSPSAFSPSAFSPSAFSPSAFSPSAFSPSAFSPSAFSPSAFSPSAFSPSAFSPAVLDPSAYSAAQSRSMIGVSAFDGTAGEGLNINTWNNTGDFYVRVRGREGVFSLNAPFKLSVNVSPGPCATFDTLPPLPPSSLQAIDGDFVTLILMDEARLRSRYPAAEVDALLAKLQTLAARPEVKGRLVDVSEDARVVAANQRADSLTACVFAKNVVVEETKAVIDRFRALNPVHYIVLVGNDDVIPFYRYPDNALIGHESNYVPPVGDTTSSQASLRLGYVLSQDLYGASGEISLNATEFPIPELPVGRLVETPTDIVTLLDAYLATSGGVAPTPTRALVTGYDFLADTAEAVRDQIQTSLGGSAVQTLITAKDISPLDARSWTADQLKSLLNGQRYDIAFLAGHFNAASALAADYRTSILTTDLLGSPMDLKNSLFFSVGCHSGYNIVTPHGISGVTFEPDWPQAFARKGATLVAGTGYQYGDTEFIEYSERLYLELARQLRTGQGPITVGDALVAAKQRYLATTPVLKGIHEKSLLEATIFGLPMFAVNLPGPRLAAPANQPVITGLTAIPTAPGNAFALKSADLTITPTLTPRTLELKNVEDNTTVAATWLQGDDGIVTSPAQPTVPLVVRNLSVPGKILRGVAYRGGTYTDQPNVTPLTGAPATELRGLHSPFQSDVFFPLRPWSVNYFDILFAGSADGITSLNVTPAQYVSSAPGSSTSTRRAHTRMDFRLYYVDLPPVSAAGAAPAFQQALADTPTIVRAQGVVVGGEVEFRVQVIGNPSAGVQGVWVTYTATEGALRGRWQSLDLKQNAADSSLWTAKLPLGGLNPASLRFFAQAVNGVGMVGRAENLGRYYVPGVDAALAPTSLQMQPLASTTAAFGTEARFAAVLKNQQGQPLAGLPVTIGVGPQERVDFTDASGRAEVLIPLLSQAGLFSVRAAFGGNAEYAASSATAPSPFEVTRQSVTVRITPEEAQLIPGAPAAVSASLVDGNGRRLVEQTVFFEVYPDTTAAAAVAAPLVVKPVISNLVGEAPLGTLLLPNGANLGAGTYQIFARFIGSGSHTASTSQGAILRVAIPTADGDVDEPATFGRLYLPLVGNQ